MRKSLVTGATGVVGVPLVRELLNKDCAVRVLVRGNITPDLFPGSVEIIKGDLNDTAALDKATDGAEWIFHLAAKLHINNASANLQKEYYETNVSGTGRLLEKAKNYGANKFIFFSTINVYGSGDGKKIFTESDEINPEGFYAESKAEAEELVLAERFGVVLRLAAVYGSRMKGNYVRLLEAVRKKRFFFVGGGANRRTLIHQQDAARAACLAAERSSGREIYNVTDGNVYTLSEIVAAMAKALGQKKPKLHLPLAPVKLAVGFAEDICKVLRFKSPVDRTLLEKLLEDIAVDGTKIQRELGFNPQFDLTNGLHETINNIFK